MSKHALVVATKFAPPRVGRGSIRRDLLIQRLREARHCRLVSITGGAGFGKTTLVALWRQELLASGANAVWLSLSADDASLAQFCASLHGALRQAGVAVGDDVLLLSEHDSDQRSVAGVLVNVLLDTPGELYLLIDDFHHVGDPRTLQLVQALLDAALPGLHLVIASRMSLPLLLGRLRATGDLCEVGGGELAFDLRETLSFLRLNLDSAIAPDAAGRIYEVTDGWPIGLQLMAIALKSNPSNRRRLRALRASGEDLDAYLSEDVIADLPQDLIEFMQRVSILRRFGPGVAAHVTGFADARRLIADICARNLFIVPVDTDDSQQWYRFHPLFSEYLGQRLASSGAAVVELHRRASDWFARHELLVEAMRHALLGDDFETVIRLLERNAPPLESVGELSLLLRWIERLPIDVIGRHPKLLLLAGWASVLTARTERAEAWVSVLKSGSGMAGTEGQIRLLEAMIASQRDEVVRAGELMEDLDRAPLDEPGLEPVRVAMLVCHNIAIGDHARARSVYRSTAAQSTRRGTGELALLAAATAALGILREGRVLEALSCAEAGLETAPHHHGRRSMSACLGASGAAGALYELDRIDEARELLANRLGMLRYSAPEILLQVSFTQGRLLWLRESRREAIDYLIHEEAHFRGLGLDRGVAHTVAERQRIVLEEGDLRHAAVLQSVLDELELRYPDRNVRDAEIGALAALARARLALARHDPQQALPAIAVVHAMAARFGRQGLQVTADLLQAQALDDLGDAAGADACLRAALATGHRLGLLRTLLDEGERACTMLARLEAADLPAGRAYLRRLRAAPGGLAPGGHEPAPTAEVLAEPPGELPLTPRERDIVVLLGQSMSNKRIALTLSISEQTVKWNLKRIFGKLGVGSRYEAVVAARSIGLRAGAD